MNSSNPIVEKVIVAEFLNRSSLEKKMMKDNIQSGLTIPMTRKSLTSANQSRAKITRRKDQNLHSFDLDNSSNADPKAAIEGFRACANGTVYNATASGQPRAEVNVAKDEKKVMECLGSLRVGPGAPARLPSWRTRARVFIRRFAITAITTFTLGVPAGAAAFLISGRLNLGQQPPADQRPKGVPPAAGSACKSV
mmetsp:Transcript_12321/g.33971  ORF Transcript_12321/g.33971 Transcript_12321/m.33971 type:complete len:195 (-) Transcript_12321:381-965(-)